MRIRFTILLILLNLSAFGAIFFLGHKANQVTGSSSSLAATIGKEVAEAERIELWGDALESTRVLERNGSTWRMTAPMEWSANFFAVNRILNQLQFLEEEASFTLSEIEKTGQTLADYGLDTPALTMNISSGKNSITLSIGALTEVGNNVYILGPSEKEIFVVSGEALKSLIIDLNELRTREIYDIPVFEVKGMTVQIKSADSSSSNGLKVRLAKTNDGWNFEAPLTAQADPTVVSSTINTLTATKVIEFIEPEALDTVDPGLQDPNMRVTLDGNKRRQTLLVGNLRANPQGKPSYFAKLENNPTIFTVLAQPFDELKQAQEALRERNFMSFNPEALTSININEGDLQIRLQKIEQKIEARDQWQVIESKMAADIQPYRADPDVIEQLIKNLKTLRATSFAVDAPNQSDMERLGFNTPRRTIKLTNADKTELNLLLAHPDNDKLYARTSAADYIYQVDRRSTLNMFPLSALFYRNRTLDSLPEAARVSSISLKNLTTDETIFEYSLTSPNATWENALTDLSEKERAAITQLVESIRRFTVKTYLSDSYTDGYQIDKDKTLPWVYALEAKILLPGGETLREDKRRYVFSERSSGTIQVGASASHNTTFQIAQSTLDALYELTESMPLPPEAKSEPIPEVEMPSALPSPETSNTAP